MDEWIKKMRYTNEMEYYLAIKKNKGTCLVEVVKNPPYNGGNVGLIPVWGTKIPHAVNN